MTHIEFSWTRATGECTDKQEPNLADSCVPWKDLGFYPEILSRRLGIDKCKEKEMVTSEF